MRKLCIAILLSVAACSAPNPDPDSQRATSDAGGPNVGVSRVPGVSLSYAYGFRLPADRIIAVQEEHAAQCEAMTSARCRITGMTYDVSAHRTISASLQFKLAPDVARAFGKRGVDTTVKRGGMLTSARIDSEESGSIAAAADKQDAEADKEGQQLSNQLAKPGLSSGERTTLQARLAELKDRQGEMRAVSDDARLKLASTPMSFIYESGAVDPGLQDGPVIGAIKDGWANVISGFAMILTLLISVLPWLVTAGLLLVGWRWAATYVRRWLLPKED